jgi:hypothetical protein
MRRLLLLATCGLGLFGSLAAQASAGTVEGTVTPIKWAQEVEVCAAGVELTAPCAVPKMDGTYSFPGLEGPIKLEFIPTYRSGLLTQYYDHKSSLGEAVIIDVPPIGEPIRGIDGDLVEGGAVTGTVTSLGALVPLSGVEVCAVSVGSSSAKSCEETDAGGAYEVHSLQGGNYRIVFRGRGATAQYEPSSTPSISVTAGATTAGVDATLTRERKSEASSVPRPEAHGSRA